MKDGIDAKVLMVPLEIVTLSKIAVPLQNLSVSQIVSLKIFLTFIVLKFYSRTE